MSDRGDPLASLLLRTELRPAVERARAAGYAIELVDLGEWGTRVRPCAELDRAERRIRIDRRLLLQALARHGIGGAAELAVAAISHELAHVAMPAASEAAIRTGLRDAAGSDPDHVVRELLREANRA